MSLRFLVLGGLVLSLGMPALAANTTMNSNGTGGQATGSQSTQNLPTEIRSKLQQDGFTNVQVVPGSFLVSAKDKNGDPVTMVIGPNSMMMLTQVPGSGNATTGSGNSGSQTSAGSSGSQSSSGGASGSK